MYFLTREVEICTHLESTEVVDGKAEKNERKMESAKHSSNLDNLRCCIYFLFTDLINFYSVILM